MEMCKSELFQFILQIIFGSIFNIYHGFRFYAAPSQTLSFMDFVPRLELLTLFRDFGGYLEKYENV